MIVLSTDQFLKKAKKGEYINAQIFEGNHLQSVVVNDKESESSMQPFERLTYTNHQDFIKALNEFIEIYPYKFIIKASSKAKLNQFNTDIINVDFGRAATQSPTLQAPSLNCPGSSQKTRSEIEAEIRQEIENEKKVIDARTEVQELKERLDKMDTLSGKLADVGTKIIMQFLGPTQVNPGATMQGTDPMNMTEKEQQVLEDALGKLITLLGADTIIKLANKLQPNDPIIGMVKNYANG